MHRYVGVKIVSRFAVQIALIRTLLVVRTRYYATKRLAFAPKSLARSDIGARIVLKPAIQTASLIQTIIVYVPIWMGNAHTGARIHSLAKYVISHAVRDAVIDYVLGSRIHVT